MLKQFYEAKLRIVTYRALVADVRRRITQTEATHHIRHVHVPIANLLSVPPVLVASISQVPLSINCSLPTERSSINLIRDLGPATDLALKAEAHFLHVRVTKIQTTVFQSIVESLAFETIGLANAARDANVKKTGFDGETESDSGLCRETIVGGGWIAAEGPRYVSWEG